MKSLSAFQKFARSDISSDVLKLKNVFLRYSPSAIHLFANTISVLRPIETKVRRKDRMKGRNWFHNIG